MSVSIPVQFETFIIHKPHGLILFLPQINSHAFCPETLRSRCPYTSNTWRALEIVVANEIGKLCKKRSVDSHEVMDIFRLRIRSHRECVTRSVSLLETYLFKASRTKPESARQISVAQLVALSLRSGASSIL
jgi:hypothetical protein